MKKETQSSKQVLQIKYSSHDSAFIRKLFELRSSLQGHDQIETSQPRQGNTNSAEIARSKNTRILQYLSFTVQYK